MRRIVHKGQYDSASSIYGKAVNAVFADFEERFGLANNFITDMDDTETYVGSKRIFNFKVGTGVYYYLSYDTNSGEWHMEVATLTDFKKWREET